MSPNGTKIDENDAKLYKLLETLKHTDYELTTCITQLQQLLLDGKEGKNKVLALIATVFAGDEKKTEKRGLLGLGYGYAGGYGHGLGYGHGYGLGHSVAVAAPVIAAPHSHSIAYSSIDHGHHGYYGHGFGGYGLGHGYGGHGLGYSHGLGLGHGYVAAPVIKTVAPVIHKTYVAPSYGHGFGLGHGYGHGLGYGGYAGHGGYYGGHGYYGHGW